jgi:tetratricopeptide (TPR) repeat protein
MAAVLLLTMAPLARAQSAASEYMEAANAAKRKDYAGALTLFDLAVQHSPTTAEIHYQRGRTLVALERRAEAEAAFREALRLRPSYAEAESALASMGIAYRAPKPVEFLKVKQPPGLTMRDMDAYRASIASLTPPPDTDDADGPIHRSSAARRAFMRETGYADGRPGYIIDHKVPLACGGADAPTNMQWQTVQDAKWKDSWERRTCVAR